MQTGERWVFGGEGDRVREMDLCVAERDIEREMDLCVAERERTVCLFVCV